MLIVSILLSIIFAMLIFEKSTVQRSVSNLQLRIHVNGTRGKSSVTEYIAAGIFMAQPEVMAKITGIIPTIIHNGAEQNIKRAGVARVQEQFYTIRLAAKMKAKSLILECMSISPELQRLESRFFKPHIYVITNIKDDHREEMGKRLEDQANSICNAIPANCTVITNEIRYLDKIKEIATANNSLVVSPQPLKPELLKRLPFGIFPENISLALAVCDVAGINYELAEQGIINRILSSKSPLFSINYDSKEIKFLNAFAVNDVDSTGSFLKHWQKNLGNNGKISVILNTRADRPIRTDLFAGWISDISSSLSNIIVTGDHVNRAKYSMLKAGVDKGKIYIWQSKHLKRLKKNLFNMIDDGSLVVGVGNIGGDGFTILSELK